MKKQKALAKYFNVDIVLITNPFGNNNYDVNGVLYSIYTERELISVVISELKSNFQNIIRWEKMLSIFKDNTTKDTRSLTNTISYICNMENEYTAWDIFNSLVIGYFDKLENFVKYIINDSECMGKTYTKLIGKQDCVYICQWKKRF